MKADKNTIEKLKKTANDLRIDVINMIYTAQSGHPGGSLSAADIITALYFHFMKTDPKNPSWEDRDRFIMSKGHACPIWYAALAKKGFFDKSELSKLRKIDGILQGHPDMLKTPGIDMTTGSLGNGLGAGVGMALSARYLKKDYYTYVIILLGALIGFIIAPYVTLRPVRAVAKSLRQVPVRFIFTGSIGLMFGLVI